MESKTFEQERKHLREAYKLYKAGLLKETDITPRIKSLLVRYYGVKFKYHSVRGKP
jgi:hypothetical protein